MPHDTSNLFNHKNVNSFTADSLNDAFYELSESYKQVKFELYDIERYMNYKYIYDTLEELKQSCDIIQGIVNKHITR